MSAQIKLGLYAVTLVGTLLFGSLFMRAWRQADAGSAQRPERGATAATAAAAENKKKAPAAPSATATSPAPASVSSPAHAAIRTAAGSDTNAAGGESGAKPETEGGVGDPASERESGDPTDALAGRGRGMGNLILWGLLAVASVLGLGGLLAYDISQYLGSKASQALFDHDGEDLPESAYEQVEKAYANGEHLEAVRLLRAFLEENPKAVHAKIRIAEIYEKDLHNPLAAALEYEEVLKYKLDPERRGWAGVHLVNLYNRLDKPDQALGWLRRVVAECPGTPAAAKARERLQALGHEVEEPPAPGSDGGEDGSGEGGLPRGFRPRH